MARSRFVGFLQSRLTSVKWWMAIVSAVAIFLVSTVAGAFVGPPLERLFHPEEIQGVAQAEECPELDRLMGDTGISMVTGVRTERDGCWLSSLADVEVGDEFEVLISFSTRGGDQADDVTLRAFLEPSLEIVTHSTRWHNARNPDGVWADHDNIVDSGINVGSYLSGANAWATFEVEVVSLPEPASECGPSTSLVWANVSTSIGSSPWATSPVTATLPCEFSSTPSP